MVNFYNRFVPHCSLLLQPLYAMVKPSKRGQSFTLVWTPDADAAFLTAKKALDETVKLSFPAQDAEISIATDVSDTGTDAVLHQLVDNDWKPVHNRHSVHQRRTQCSS